MPTHRQNLQKSFQGPAQEKRNLKKCPTAQVDIENENKNEKKIKHESTTMCIVHSTLRDATTPYTERCKTLKPRKMKNKEIEDLIERIKELESNSNLNQEITESKDVKPVIKEILKITDFDKEEIVNLDSASVELRFEGNPSSGRTGFPDNRGYCKYWGTAYVQDNVGNIYNWYYMESNSVKKHAPQYPEGRPNARGYKEARNGQKIRMGWNSRWFGGSCRWVGCWARFVDQSGNGWRFHWTWE